MDQVDLVGVTPEQKRAAGSFDDRYLVPGQEAVDDGWLERPALGEPDDRELAPDSRAGDGGQGASKVMTRPSKPSIRAPG